MQELTSPAQAAMWLQQQGCTTLSTDSRDAGPEVGFVAWPGARADARQYVGSALSQGAHACLVERAGAESFAFNSDQVGAYPGLQANLGAIASQFFGEPSRQLSVIAVTGTNGKTSTAWWLAQALSAVPQGHAIPCGVIGTLGVGRPPAAGVQAPPAPQTQGLAGTGFTTPDPVVLQKTLRSFVHDGLQACTIEASSIGIKEQRLDGTHIRVAVFTNFTQDHLDYHGSMDAYWQSKKMLFYWPGLSSAVINIDDVMGAELAQQLKATGLDVWTVSADKPARLQARHVSYSAQGIGFEVAEGADAAHVHSHVLGAFNVLNLLGVIATMRALGVPLAQAAKVCNTLRPVPGRMECLGGDGQPVVAVDYAHTPDALGQALSALRPMAAQRGGKLWCVFGCGGDRDASKRPLMGAIAIAQADHVMVTSDNPRSERPEAIIAQILLGANQSPSVEVNADRAQAIATVLAHADAADVVLLAGKGHEQTQEVAGAKLPFSDRSHALQALQLRQKTLGEVQA